MPLPDLGPHAAGDRPASGAAAGEGTEAVTAVDWVEVTRIALVGLVAAAVWSRGAPGHLRLLGLAATLVGGYPIFKGTIRDIVARRMTMELSMTIALVAALAIGETVTALLMTGFVLVAEVLERLTMSRGRRAIRQLVEFLPRHVSVRCGDGFAEISLHLVRVGDRILIRPGGRIPVDGVVVDGESTVDQSTITGESGPRGVRRGDRVFAGSLNQSGALDVQAERVGLDTTFGQIIDAVEHAGELRAPIQRMADRLAGYLVYGALGAAALTFLATRDVRATISVVIVAGACGVAAGTPLAILGAIGRAARAGAIIKGGRHLEALWSIGAVVLDKTGTLTFGDMRVQEIRGASGVAAAAVLEAAATAEAHSEHPIGRAIVAHAAQRGCAIRAPARFAYTPGQGVRAYRDGEEILVGTSMFVTEGRLADRPGAEFESTTVFVTRGGRYLGSISLDDVARPEARKAVQGLRALGLRTYLLTGDSKTATARMARDLAFDEVQTGLMPDAKLRRVQALERTGRVAMVGDGVNDAPSLLAATVGIAMGSGADVTRECADIVLIGNDLGRLVDVVRLARRARRIIVQNFVGTIVVDIVGIGLASAGLLAPAVAALIHVTSELVFLLNAARLVPPPLPRTVVLQERSSPS